MRRFYYTFIFYDILESQPDKLANVITVEVVAETYSEALTEAMKSLGSTETRQKIKVTSIVEKTDMKDLLDALKAIPRA